MRNVPSFCPGRMEHRLKNPPLLYNGMEEIFQVFKEKGIEKDCWQENYYNYHVYMFS